MVIARGFLYAPTAASNPGQFDFKAYLARRGIFTGMSASVVQSIDGAGRFPQQLTVPRQISRTLQYGLWQLRRRIVRSHAAGLGQPEGALISGMLLGRHAVDVPHDIRDRFASVGLAHTLAASGFHVSLLLGVMLWLTQRSSARWRLGVCLGFLLLYVGLTGVQPSVLRAALMGGAVVLATVLERQIKPLGSLLLAAVLLLWLNPLWIWELGFQLSFLATLGLLVTAPCVQRQLDWLPPAIAPLIAIPIAAYVWTLPLQMHAFGVVSVYSIGINVITAPLVSVMTLGGAIAAAVGVLSPMLGSWVASVLYYPTHGLLLLVEWVSHLPGNGFATGTITVVQVGLLYAVYGLVWWVARVQRHWWVMGVLCVGLVALPAWSRTQQQFQATILTTADAPVMVVQKPGEVGLIGSLSERDAEYVVLPFLRTQGINRVDWAIAPQLSQTSAGWRQVLQQVSIRILYNASTLAIDPSQPLQHDLLHALGTRGGRSPFLPLNQAIAIGSMPVRLISLNPVVLRFQLGDLIWLMLGDRPARDRPTPIFANALSAANVLWFDGRFADQAVIQAVNPSVAIASGTVPAAELQAWLQQTDIQFLAAERDGAVQWSPKVGFSRYNLADAE
jgi:competence protein ComEC